MIVKDKPVTGYVLNGNTVVENPFLPTFEIVGWFNTNTGYGNETVSLTRALDPMIPAIRARSATPPLPPEVVFALTRSPEAVEDSIWFSTPNDMQWHPESRIRQHAITMWETTEVPEQFAKNFKGVTNVFCPCPASVEAFQKLLPDKQVRLLTFGTESALWGPPVKREWAGPLHFGMVCTASSRKYVLETIRAFEAAFGDREDADLEIVNSTGADFYKFVVQDSKNIVFRTLGGGMTQPELKRWYQSKHVLLFVSRGEGNGRPVLEMACTGGAVVATKGMGTYWLSNTLGFPISYKLVPVKGFPWCVGEWMEPNFDEYVETLRYIDSNRGQTAERARQLSDVVPRMFNWDTTAMQLMSML